MKIKKLSFMLLLIAISTSIIAQKKELPSPVKESFLEKYPNATEIKHNKQKKAYKIRFNNEGNKTTSVFDFDGNWKRTESILKDDAIPEKVKKSIQKKYPNGSYSNVTLTETSEGEFLYKVIVDTDKATFLLDLDKSGKITKTSKRTNDTPATQESDNDGGGEE